MKRRAASAKGEPPAPAPGAAAVVPENREHQRHYTIMRTAKLATGKGEGLGIVRNVSDGGMKIDVVVPPAIGEAVTVSLFDGQQIAATVIWQQGSEIGVSFAKPFDVSEVLTVPERLENGKPPRLPRLKADRETIIDAGQKQIATAKIRDVSQRGARIAVGKPLTRGQDVWLRPSGVKPVRATVRWCRDGEAGIAFHETLGVETVMAWLRDPAG